jgi:hypothetical protein
MSESFAVHVVSLPPSSASPPDHTHQTLSGKALEGNSK